MKSTASDTEDHGEVVTRRRAPVSWAWLFPILAAIAAGWMFWSDWKSNGPEIEIEFRSAPGMHPGKTALIYRGVVAGTVSGVRLDESLSKVVVSVRLKSFAADLARQGTTFWIEQPVLSLTQASGIESLIDGNSIQAELGNGPPSTRFEGSNKIPITEEGKSHFSIRLTNAKLPLLDRGSPVYFRGIQVGVVSKKDLDENHDPYLDILIEQEYADLLGSNARFWYLPPTSVKIGAGILKVDFDGLKSLLFGSITFDYFGDRGTSVQNGTAFSLNESEAEARANSAAFRLVLDNGQGILAGETQLRYLGVPVGLVEEVAPSEGKVVVTARLESGYEFLRRSGSIFTVIRPTLTIQKVTGLETLVSGIYIDCIPNSGGSISSHFHGTPQEEADLRASLDSGFEVVVQTPSTKIGPGANVLYRGVVVGKVVKKSLSPDGRSVNLFALVDQTYAPLLRENSKFWNAGGISISGGIISLKVQAPAFESRALEGIQFATPEGPAMGQEVTPGHVYELNDSPRKEWLQWSPSISLTGDK
jgi:paraquat-inducible protein B